MLFNEQPEPVETDLLATASVHDGEQAEPEEELENEINEEEADGENAEASEEGEEG
ncbi:MAG: hypothetical protein ABIQ93_11820 [Saprospiraceae bacterium]